MQESKMAETPASQTATSDKSLGLSTEKPRSPLLPVYFQTVPPGIVSIMIRATPPPFLPLSDFLTVLFSQNSPLHVECRVSVTFLYQLVCSN